jgi:hypothetical protein
MGVGYDTPTQLALQNVERPAHQAAATLPWRSTMDKLRLAAQLALETLEKFVSNELTVGQRYTNEGEQILVSIYKLRAALAEQDVSLIDEGKKAEPQEPVAWMITDNYERKFLFRLEKPVVYKGETLLPLYTAPQPRREVELTDEQIDDIYYCVEGGANALETWRQQARAIEAAHDIGEQK